MDLDARKPAFRGFADKTVHPCSLIRAFVIIFLESSLSELATSEISIFLLVSVDLGLAFWKPRRQDLSSRSPLLSLSQELTDSDKRTHLMTDLT